MNEDEYTPPFPSVLMIFTDDLEWFDELTAEQVGQVMLAVIKTYLTGENQREAITDPEVKAAYRVISKGVERNKEKYYEKCRKNRENRKAREKNKDSN
ncbi:MAG: DUF6291 domain-containing protein [Ruminococcus flavefaciens]|nr:DUF6291 domain-containing protein [Ruminococcus flavefaciens]MCM1062245.1 DUF6291 domain-containing protein [Eubacterium sp.]